MVCSLVSISFDSPQNDIQWKQTVRNFRLLTQRNDQFWFLGKGLGIVYSQYFVYDFSRKFFLILSFINWPNFIVWLLLLLVILAMLYYNCLLPRLWRHKFSINLIFLITAFFCMTKTSRQKPKYLENEKSF